MVSCITALTRAVAVLLIAPAQTKASSMISCDDEEFELGRADEGEGGERKKFEVELKSKKQ